MSSSTSKIPLGNFYGYTFASSSQLVVVDGVNSANSSRTFDEAKSLSRTSLSVEQLRQLEEDVTCRYNLACDLLRNLLDSPEASSNAESSTREKETESLMVRELCREISSIRVQWNLIHRAIDRMNLASGNVRMTINVNESFDQRIGYDKARFISELLFSSMIRLSPLMKGGFDNDATLFMSADSRPVLPLNMAVDIFERFCFSGVPW